MSISFIQFDNTKYQQYPGFAFNKSTQKATTLLGKNDKVTEDETMIIQFPDCGKNKDLTITAKDAKGIKRGQLLERYIPISRLIRILSLI